MQSMEDVQKASMRGDASPLRAALDVSQPKRGRRATIPVVEEMPPDNYEAGAAVVMEALRKETLPMLKGELAQSQHVAESVGMIAAFQLNEAVNRVAMLKKFQDLRDSRAYKGATLLDKRSGELVTVQTWEAFCEVHGYSKRKIDEDLQNLAIFGGSLLEAQEALGLGYRDLRLLRAGLKALPLEEQAKVLADLQDVEGNDKAKEKLDELRVKLAQTEVALSTAKADITAKETVSKGKSAKIDKLTEEVTKLKSLTVDANNQRLAAKTLEARKELDTACHQVVGVLNTVLSVCTAMQEDDEIDMATRKYMNERVGLMCDLMGEAILDIGVDVDFSTRFSVDYGPDGDPIMVALPDADTVGA